MTIESGGNMSARRLEGKPLTLTIDGGSVMIFDALVTPRDPTTSAADSLGSGQAILPVKAVECWRACTVLLHAMPGVERRCDAPVPLILYCFRTLVVQFAASLLSWWRDDQDLLCKQMPDSKACVRDWLQLGQAEREFVVSRVELGHDSAPAVRKDEYRASFTRVACRKQDTQVLQPVQELMEELLQTLELVAADESKQLVLSSSRRLLSPVEEGDEQAPHVVDDGPGSDAYQAVQKSPMLPVVLVSPPLPTNNVNAPTQTYRRPAAARCLMRTNMASRHANGSEGGHRVLVVDDDVAQPVGPGAATDTMCRQPLPQSPGKTAAAVAARVGLCVCVCV